MNNRQTSNPAFPTTDFVFEQQGRKTFFKLKPDWLRFGKLHLSFVSHEDGQSRQAIESGLDIRDASYLIEAIRRGDIAKARVSGTQTLYQYLGGTAKARSRTGKPVSKVLSLQPGSKVDYLVNAAECEGVESAIGGISPKPGAQTTRIAVGMMEKDLLALANCMDRLLNTWQIHQLMNRMEPFSMWQECLGQTQQSVSPSPALPDSIWIVEDSWMYHCEAAASPECCLSKLQDIIRLFHDDMNLDNQSYRTAESGIQNHCEDIPPVLLKKKDGSDSVAIYIRKVSCS